MIVEVGNILKAQLQSLSFIDKLAGVVKVLTKVDMDKDNKPVKFKFPVACDVDYESCLTTGKYKDLIPNSSAGCIVFLEDNGLRFTGMHGHKQKWEGTYRLVSWVNNKKLGKEECSVTGQIIATIINALTVIPFNSGSYQMVNINVAGQEPKTGQNPFSKYTLSEEQTQFLMYPFDSFSLLINVSFEIDKRCLTPFEISDPTVC